MKNDIKDKIDDFTKWSAAAIAHYNNGLYADSLINMRKSGEAACKLMFYYEFRETLANEKTTGKTYKELILAVIQNDLAPRKVINWLEALQVHGNEAAHDVKINKDQCEYTLRALGFLIEWIFNECVKAAVPSNLKKLFAELNQPLNKQTDNTDLKKELEQIKKEKEDLQKQINILSGKNTEESDKINKLTSDLIQSIDVLKEIEEKKEKNSEEKPIEETVIPVEKKKSNTNKKLILSGLILLLIIIGAVIIIKTPFIIKKNKNTVTKTKIVSDSFSIMIMQLTELQENPNMKLNFEDALESVIKQRIKEKNIPVSIIRSNNSSKISITSEDAIKAGIKQKVYTVIYGDIYEPMTSKDSTQVNLKIINARKDAKIEELGSKSFLRLSDSSAIKIMLNAANFVELSYAQKLIDAGKINKALTLLYDIKPTTTIQKTEVYKFLSNCHALQQKYEQAINDIKNYIVLNPDDDKGYSSLAMVYMAMNKLIDAKKCFDKAFSIKRNNVPALLNYANILASAQFRDYEGAERYTLETLQYDSTNSTAYGYLGDLEAMKKNFQMAEKLYKKAIKLQPLNISAKINLAQMYAFKLKEYSEGEKILIDLLKKDHTNQIVISYLISLYTLPDYSNPEKAALLNKLYSQLNSSRSTYTNNYNDALIEFNNGNYEKALKPMLAVFSIDSSDISLSSKIANCYLNLKDFDKSYHYMMHAWALDSFDCINNLNVGYFYCFTTNKKYFDLKKSVSFLEKAKKTCPDDTNVLYYLSDVYYSLGEIAKSKQILMKVKSMFPNNFKANSGLGQIFMTDKDYEKASGYFKNVLNYGTISPYIYYNYAFCIAKVSENNVPVAIEYALKAYNINPQNADFNDLLAELYCFQKNYNLARIYYDAALKYDPSYKSSYYEKLLH